MLTRRSTISRAISGFLAFLMVTTNLEKADAQGTPFIPARNYFVDLSVPYSLPVLRGMRTYPDKPFQFDFLVGSGNSKIVDQKQTALLIKYFLTCLTVPQEDLWVNLSPYEHDRIIPDELSLTDAGNTLLLQDKLLKQLASSLTYPEGSLGRKFWNEVYKRAYEKYRTTNLPINTYNKVWIVPDKAVVYDMGNSAIIGETHLKVMLEDDYLAMKKHQVHQAVISPSNFESQIAKEIILPELEKEINEGKHFAPVRQIFHSMVLAAWFKHALRRNVLARYYVDQKKIAGVDGIDKSSKEAIYKQYLRIYKVGAYNYIREDVDPISNQVVPRKYFSGGAYFGRLNQAMLTLQVPPGNIQAIEEKFHKASVNDLAMAVARVNLTTGKDKLNRWLLGSNKASLSILAQADAAMVSSKANTKKGNLNFIQLLALVVVGSSAFGVANGWAQNFFKSSSSTTPAINQKMIATSVQGSPATTLTTASGQTEDQVSKTDGSNSTSIPQATIPVSRRVIGEGDTITQDDHKDLENLLRVVGTDGFKALTNRINQVTGTVYTPEKVDQLGSLNWDNYLQPGQHLGWQAEALIVAGQNYFQSHDKTVNGRKVNIDGLLGSQTREAEANAFPSDYNGSASAQGDVGNTTIGINNPFVLGDSSYQESPGSNQPLDPFKTTGLLVANSYNHEEIANLHGELNTQHHPLSRGNPVSSFKKSTVVVWHTSSKVIAVDDRLQISGIGRIPDIGSNSLVGNTYSPNETLFSLEYPTFQANLNKHKFQLDVLKRQMEQLRKLKGSNADHDPEVVNLQTQIDAVQEEIDQDSQQIDNNRLISPGKIKIKNPSNVYSGMTIGPRSNITIPIRFYDRWSANFQIPIKKMGLAEHIRIFDDKNHELAFAPVAPPSPDFSPEYANMGVQINESPEKDFGNNTGLNVQFEDTNDPLSKLLRLSPRDFTVVNVNDTNHLPVTNTVEGSVSLKVKLGQKVQKGDAIATADVSAFERQRDDIIAQMNDNNMKYNQLMASGQATNSELDKIKIEQSDLLGQLDVVNDNIRHAQVLSPYTGEIVKIASQNQGQVLGYGAKLVEVNDGTAYLGDVNNENNPIWLPAKYFLHSIPGDKVGVIGLDKNVYVGVIQRLGPAYSTKYDVSGKVSVELTVKSPLILQKGLPVEVVPLLTAKEKKIADEIYQSQEKETSGQAGSGGGNGPPDPNAFTQSLFSSLTPVNSQLPSVSLYQPLPPYFAPQGSTQTISQVQALAAQHGLDGVIANLQAQAHQKGEDITLQSRTSINAGVYHGQIVVGGGISGQGYQFNVTDLFSPKGWANIVLSLIGNSKDRDAARYDARVIQPIVTRELDIRAASIVLGTSNSAGVKASEADLLNQQIQTWQTVSPRLEEIRKTIYARVDAHISSPDLKGDIDQRLTVIDPFVPNTPLGIPDIKVLTSHRDNLINDLIQNGFLPQGTMPATGSTFLTISSDQIAVWRAKLAAYGILSNQAFAHAHKAIDQNKAFEIALKNGWIVLRQDGKYDLQSTFRNLSENEIFSAIDRTTQKMYKTTWDKDTKKAFTEVLQSADSVNDDIRMAIAIKDEMIVRGVKIGVDNPNNFFTFGSALSPSVSGVNGLPYALWPSTEAKTFSSGNDYFVAGSIVLKDPGKKKQEQASALQTFAANLGETDTSNKVLVDYDTAVSTYNDLVGQISNAEAAEKSDFNQINAIQARLTAEGTSKAIDALWLKLADAQIRYAKDHVYTQTLQQQVRVASLNLDVLLGGNVASSLLIQDKDKAQLSVSRITTFFVSLFVLAVSLTSSAFAQQGGAWDPSAFGRATGNVSSTANDSNPEHSQSIHQYLSNQNANSPILSGSTADIQDDFIAHAKGGISALGYFYQAKRGGWSSLANQYIDDILASVPVSDYLGHGVSNGISIGNFQSLDQVIGILGSFSDASIGKGNLKKSMISWPLPILQQLYNRAHGQARLEIGDIIFRAVALNNLDQTLRPGAFGQSTPSPQDTSVGVILTQEKSDWTSILNNSPLVASLMQQRNPNFYKTALDGARALIPGYDPISFSLQESKIVLLPNYRLSSTGWQYQLGVINGFKDYPAEESRALSSNTNNNGLLINNLKSSTDPRSGYYLVVAYLAGKPSVFSAISQNNFQASADAVHNPGAILNWRRGLIHLYKSTGNLNHFQTLVSTYTDIELPEILNDLHTFGIKSPADFTTRIATASQANIVLQLYKNQIDGNPTADGLPVISPSDVDTVIGLRQAARVYQNELVPFATTLSNVPYNSPGLQFFFKGIDPRAKSLATGDWNLPSTPTFSTNKALNNLINNKPANVIISEIINSNDHGLIHQHARFLVNQKYTDLVTLVRAINAAFVHGNQFAVVQLLEALDDILTIHPDLLQTLTPDDFEDDGNSQFPISSQIADKVFLSLLLYKKGSIGTGRFLQSGYWRTDDLLVLSNGLNAQNDQDARYLGGLLNGVEGAKRRKDNVTQVFSLGPFELGGPFILDADVQTSVWIKRQAKQNGLFLSVSPRWTDGGYTPLLDISIPKSSPSAQVQNPDVSFFRVSSQANGFDYLNNLSVADQLSVLAGDEPDLAKYVGDISIPVANRIQALPNLENDLSGRLLMLDEYNKSQDPQLLDAIESNDWLNTLMGDLPNIDNPGSMGIVQTALLKNFKRHPDNYRPIMILARTYTDLELHNAAGDIFSAVSNTPGLLGDYQQQILDIIDAQEKVVGTTVALDALDKKISYRDVWVAGFRVQSVPELDELSRIKNKIAREIDPRQINSYIERQAQEVTDKETKDMFSYILSIRDRIALKLKNNEQSVPKIPQLWYWLGATAFGGFIIWGIKKLINLFQFNQLKKDTVDYIIYIAGNVIYLEHFDGLNGVSDSPEPAEGMVRIREDGVKIINMPEPVTVDKKAKKPMKEWWEIITRWNSRQDLTADELVADFHRITESAFDALKTIPYEAKLMQSPSGSYQKTLFYYSTIANYTFYLLIKNLERVKGLTQGQKNELKDDANRLVESIPEYVTEYSKRLHYRANDNRVWNRTLPSNHPYELRRWYLFGQSWYGTARKILAFDYLKNKSDKEGIKSEKRLMESGDRLLGVYPRELREDIKAQAAEFLKIADQSAGMDGSSRTRQSEIADRVGNFWREIKYPIQMWFFIAAATSASFFTPGIARFAPEFSPLSIFFMTWSVWWYAKPNLEFLDMGWAKQINGLVLDQQRKINRLIDAAQVAIVTRASNQDKAQQVSYDAKKTKGGIDLNFQPQFIQRGKGSDAAEISSVNLPFEFKGFNFNIVRFTPNLTINSAFNLMFGVS